MKIKFGKIRKSFVYVFGGSVLTAVSYTHLDVYKRQVSEASFRIVKLSISPGDKALRSPKSPNIPSITTRGSLPPEREVAVSYTHLDVYKRQA